MRRGPLLVGAATVGTGLIVAGIAVRNDPPICIQPAGFECPPAPDQWESVALVVTGGLLLAIVLLAAGVELVASGRAESGANERKRVAEPVERPRPASRSVRPRRREVAVGRILQTTVRAVVLAFLLIFGLLAFSFHGYREDGGSEPVNGLPVGVLMFAAAGALAIAIARHRLAPPGLIAFAILTIAALAGVAVATLEWTNF